MWFLKKVKGLSSNPTNNNHAQQDRQREHCTRKNMPSSIDTHFQGHFQVLIRRRPLLYVVGLLIPSIFLMLVDVMSFYLPINSGTRVTFKTSTLLGYTVFRVNLMDELPATAVTTPLIGKRLVCCQGRFGLRTSRKSTWVPVVFFFTLLVCQIPLGPLSLSRMDEWKYRLMWSHSNVYLLVNPFMPDSLPPLYRTPRGVLCGLHGLADAEPGQVHPGHQAAPPRGDGGAADVGVCPAARPLRLSGPELCRERLHHRLHPDAGRPRPAGARKWVSGEHEKN